jgi:predicted nucleic acid-binding protein
MGANVLADSNIYIALLRAKRDAVATLFEWIQARGGDLSVCGMIRLEVLRGIKRGKCMDRLTAFMDAMVNISSDHDLWMEATELAWKLDRKGIVIPEADIVTAASALRAGAAILTSDIHFQQIDGLQVLSPPEEWFGR